MKILIFAILLTSNYSVGITQSTSSTRFLNSLKSQLADSKQDTSRILIMASLCDIYRTSKPDTALFYGEKAISMAQSINFPKGLVRAISETARVYQDMGNLPKALKMQYRALQIAEDNNLLYEQASIFIFVGSIYSVLQNYPRVLNYYKKSKQIYELYQDEGRIAFVDMGIGSTFASLNQLDSSLFYMQKANKYHVFWYRAMGSLQHKLGNDDLALQYLHKGIQVAQNQNNFRVLAYELNDISSIYKKKNLIDSSIFYAKWALQEAEEISFKQQILIANTQLAELYEPIDTKKSVFYYQRAAATRESLFDLGNMHMITQEEENQREIENQKEIYQNKLKQYALIGGLCMLLLIALFLYRNSQKEKKAKNLLQEQKDKVDKTLSQLKSTQAQLIQSEKMASLGELTAGIAHEIQNPLNFVNNFSEVSNELIVDMVDEVDKGNYGEVKTIAMDVKQNLTKINHHGRRASDIVKGMLEHSKKSTGVKESTDINALCDEYLRLAYQSIKAKDNDLPAGQVSFNATMKTHFDPNLPKIDIIPQDIGRVLLNLINNAFYAVNERSKTGEKGYHPSISITTQLTDNNQIQISVKDNGSGIPDAIKDKIFQPFFTTKPTGQGTGLGLSLSYDIVKANGGTIEVQSITEVSTEFIIKLPFKTYG